MPERLPGLRSVVAAPKLTMSSLARAKAVPRARRATPRHPCFVALVLGVAMGLAACSSSESADKEPVVSVQAEPAQRTNIQQKIVAEAILYPIHEAAITPKVSAPVLKFDVKDRKSVV